MQRFAHTAWTPPSPSDSIVLLGGGNNHGCGTACDNAEIVPGAPLAYRQKLSHSIGGQTFKLRHQAYMACAITDGETVVLTGGGIPLKREAYDQNWIRQGLIIRLGRWASGAGEFTGGPRG